MTDTNVLLSAFALRGTGATQLVRVVQRQYHLLVADYSFEENWRVSTVRNAYRRYRRCMHGAAPVP